MTRRFWIITVGGLLLVGIAALSWRHYGQSHRLTAGPLTPSEPNGVTMIAKGVGIPVGAGTLEFHNPGSEPAKIDDVSLIHPTGGLRLMGVFLARVPQDTPKGAWATTFWPPPGETLHPLHAVSLRPHATSKNGRWVQLMIEVKLTHPGHGSFRGVDIRYHVGDREYEFVDPFSVGVCYPKPSGDCPLPHPVGVSAS